MTDGFEVDPTSLDRFRTGSLDDLQVRVAELRARLASSAVPGHAYTTTEPGLLGADSHGRVVAGFDHRLALATQQLETLDERVRASAAEYRRQDESGSERVVDAGAGVEGVA